MQCIMQNLVPLLKPGDKDNKVGLPKISGLGLQVASSDRFSLIIRGYCYVHVWKFAMFPELDVQSLLRIASNLVLIFAGPHH